MVDGAALVMRAVAEGGTSSAAPMREAALGEGAMLHHLAIAVAGKARSQPCSPCPDGCLSIYMRIGCVTAKMRCFVAIHSQQDDATDMAMPQMQCGSDGRSVC